MHGAAACLGGREDAGTWRFSAPPPPAEATSAVASSSLVVVPSSARASRRQDHVPVPRQQPRACGASGREARARARATTPAPPRCPTRARDRVTERPRHRDTETPRHRDTEDTPTHRNTERPKNRDRDQGRENTEGLVRPNAYSPTSPTVRRAQEAHCAVGSRVKQRPSDRPVGLRDVADWPAVSLILTY